MKIRTRERSTLATPSTPNPELLFQRALRRARLTARRALEGPVLAGALALSSGPALVGCTLDQPGIAGAELASTWAHEEGERDTAKVSYLGSYWSDCTNHNPRFGCAQVDVFVKVRVQPTAGADLDWKRVGVITRDLATGTEATATGYYFSTYADGDEEWHVPVSIPAWRDAFTFTAWYQDGAYNTYYDDNAGEQHVIANDGDTQIVRVEPWLNTLAVTGAGVSGTVSLRLADLDYDKRLELIGTVDDWNTVLEYGMVEVGGANGWYWVEDLYGGMERWQIDLDLPGDYERFEYAVVYHHGVVDGAVRYDFWDNNWNQNYAVERDAIE